MICIRKLIVGTFYPTSHSFALPGRPASHAGVCLVLATREGSWGRGVAACHWQEGPSAGVHVPWKRGHEIWYGIWVGYELNIGYKMEYHWDIHGIWKLSSINFWLFHILLWNSIDDDLPIKLLWCFQFVLFCQWVLPKTKFYWIHVKTPWFSMILGMGFIISLAA